MSGVCCLALRVRFWRLLSIVDQNNRCSVVWCVLLLLPRWERGPRRSSARVQVQGLVDRSTQGQDLTELCLKLAKDDQKTGTNMDMALAKPIESGL